MWPQAEARPTLKYMRRKWIDKKKWLDIQLDSRFSSRTSISKPHVISHKIPACSRSFGLLLNAKDKSNMFTQNTQPFVLLLERLSKKESIITYKSLLRILALAQLFRNMCLTPYYINAPY